MEKTPLRVRIGMFAFALVMVASLLIQRQNIALALSRITWYYQQNPISTWLNLQQRDLRVGLGTYWYDAFGGPGGTFNGTYSGLLVSPVTGLYVAVAPSNAAYAGALYQAVADDTSAWGGYPQGTGPSALPADSTNVVGQAILTAGTPNIGPLTVGASSGQSVIDLIECQVVPSVDQTSSTINLINGSGTGLTPVTANRDRIDSASCRFKASASSSSPTVPAADVGWIAIGYATLPYGTSTINSGQITSSPAFTGFVQADAGTCVGCTLSGGTLSGVGVTGSSGQGAAVCMDGSNTLNASFGTCGAAMRSYTSAGQMTATNFVNVANRGCTFSSSTTCTASFTFVQAYSGNVTCTATPESATTSPYTSIIVTHTGTSGFGGASATLTTSSSVSGTVVVDFICFGD